MTFLIVLFFLSTVTLNYPFSTSLFHFVYFFYLFVYLYYLYYLFVVVCELSFERDLRGKKKREKGQALVCFFFSIDDEYSCRIEKARDRNVKVFIRYCLYYIISD